MSYGRSPYYIYQGEYDEGETYFCFMDGGRDDSGNSVFAEIEYDAMAQFIATMWRRENRDIGLLEGELKQLILRGLEVRPVLVQP